MQAPLPCAACRNRTYRSRSRWGASTATPPRGATLEQLFACVEWIAPGFEIVQSHCEGWKFGAADTVADGGLHARLLVGRQRPLRDFASDGAALDALLASLTPKTRAAWLHSRLDGMTHAEIAAQLGVSVPRVRQYLATAARRGYELRFGVALPAAST